MDAEKMMMQRRIDNLMEQLELVKRQRDALMREVRKHVSCEQCVHGHECRWPDDYKECRRNGFRKWEWRGLCKENGGVE